MGAACLPYLRGGCWDTCPHRSTGGGGRWPGSLTASPQLHPSPGANLSPWRDEEAGEEGDSYLPGPFHGLRMSSHAISVGIGLSFHFKSKFQIKTEKVKLVGGMDGWGWPFFLSLFSNFNFCDCSQSGPERVNYQLAFRTDSRRRWRWEGPRKSEQTHRGSFVGSRHPAPF